MARHLNRVLFAWSLVVIAGACALFVVAGLEKTGGAWPAPLDDVFIYFDFARSTARGHPFTWVIGNGYSSGGTSIVYPFVLAAGYLVGFRGASLGVFASIVAVVSLVDLARSVRRISTPLTAFLAPVVIVAVPLLDWTWFSGMEVALTAAFIGRALVAAKGIDGAAGTRRSRAQLRAGIYLALVAISRPECLVLAPLLGVAITVRSGAAPVWSSLARSIGPTVAFVFAIAILNFALTGEAQAAGAVRKLVTSNPYLSSADVAAVVLKNLAQLRTAGVEIPLGGTWGSLAIEVLALVACVDRRSRSLAVPLVIAALGTLALAALNTTAPYQNMRYATPALALLLLAALLGFDVLARRGRLGAGAGAALLLVFGVCALRAMPRQIDHYARASRNIAEQQATVGKRLAKERPRRIFVGDAGAIPYFADTGALDGLGLGGYHDLPFARASVHGVPAVIELIERLPPSERPDVLAIYDGWWPSVGANFGTPWFDVTIDDNVICADPKKRVYHADWSLLEDRSVLKFSIASTWAISSTKKKRTRSRCPGRTGGVRRGQRAPRRIGRSTLRMPVELPVGMAERFVVRGAFSRGPHALTIRTDDAEARTVRVEAAGKRLETTLLPVKDGAWSETRIDLDDVGPGDAIAVRGVDGAFRSFAYTLD